MRQTASSGSVKAFFLDRAEILERLRKASVAALAEFPEIREVRLFGSLAKGEETGLSDIDIFIVADSEHENPIEIMRPYFNFFSDRLGLAVDIFVAKRNGLEHFQEILRGSVLMAGRPEL